ncbi:hypothetical protein CH377_05725 [Leptospira haakeii]|nr:hypothetical protein CH377_05725 [Leptospira haakeii]
MGFTLYLIESENLTLKTKIREGFGFSFRLCCDCVERIRQKVPDPKLGENVNYSKYFKCSEINYQYFLE